VRCVRRWAGQEVGRAHAPAPPKLRPQAHARAAPPRLQPHARAPATLLEDAMSTVAHAARVPSSRRAALPRASDTPCRGAGGAGGAGGVGMSGAPRPLIVFTQTCTCSCNPPPTHVSFQPHASRKGSARWPARTHARLDNTCFSAGSYQRTPALATTSVAAVASAGQVKCPL